MNFYYEVGDTVKGDKIICEARKISKPKVVPATGRHSAQQITLWENAFAVVEKKTRFLPRN